MSKRTVGASEGDAYRYTKKALLSLPNSNSLKTMIEQYYGTAVSWTRTCYSIIRARFFMNGISNILFAPGVARIAYGELHLDDDNEKGIELQQLDQIVQMISANHKDDYTRNLLHDGRYMSFSDLNAIYGSVIKNKTAELEAFLESRKYKAGHYKIVPMTDFSVAKKYDKYAKKYFSWCHLSDESTFKSYQRGGLIKLYLALKKGYRKLTPDDPGFGESMLGIDIGPRGELVHVNNRWNHARDNVDEKKGDNKYDAVELSDLLGKPYYKACPPNSREEMQKFGVIYKTSDKIISEVSHGEMVDPRDGNKYKTVTIGGVTIMAEDFRYLYNPSDYDSVHAKLVECLAHNEVNFSTPTKANHDINIDDYLPDFVIPTCNESVGYNWYAANCFAPNGWHVPSTDDMVTIMKALGYVNPFSPDAMLSHVWLDFPFEDYNIDGTIKGLDLFRAVGMMSESDRGIIHWMQEKNPSLIDDSTLYETSIVDTYIENVDEDVADALRGRLFRFLDAEHGVFIDEANEHNVMQLHHIDTLPNISPGIEFPIHNPITELKYAEIDDWQLDLTTGDEVLVTDTDWRSKFKDAIGNNWKHDAIARIVNFKKTQRARGFTSFDDGARCCARHSGSFLPVRYVKG